MHILVSNDKNQRHYLDFSLCPSPPQLSQITLLSLVMSSRRIFAKTPQFWTARRRRIFITRPGAGKMLDTICLNISEGVEKGPEGPIINTCLTRSDTKSSLARRTRQERRGPPGGSDLLLVPAGLVINCFSFRSVFSQWIILSRWLSDSLLDAH